VKTASIRELKEELGRLNGAEVTSLCLRLARFKKENKELLTYLLFEAGNEEDFITGIKSETTEAFKAINSSNIYLAKKSIRKILRTINKYIRYTASVQVEVELLLHFCFSLKHSGIPFQNSTALDNLFRNQLNKISKSLDTLHEDLQFDYRRQLTGISGQ
jgi:hypothetical protein